MFEIAAHLGFDLGRKLNWNLIHEYDPEILQIIPEPLSKSPLILEQISQCFPEGAPYIYSHEMVQLYPKTYNQVKIGDIQSKLHRFSVQLDDQTTKYCYALTYYETAYIQNIETLAGKLEKTLSSKLELCQLQNSKNPIKSASLFNNHVKVYVQSSIVISSCQEETGCEATLVTYINQLLGIDSHKMNRQWKDYVKSVQLNGFVNTNKKFLEEILYLNQQQLMKQQKLPTFQLTDLLEFLNTNNLIEKKIIIPVEDLNENVKVGIIKSIKIEENSEEFRNKSNAIFQELYHLNEMSKQITKYPIIRRMKQGNKKISRQQQYAPVILQTQNVQDMKYNKKTQDFSFHYSETKAKSSKIFQDNPRNFPIVRKHF